MEKRTTITIVVAVVIFAAILVYASYFHLPSRSTPSGQNSTPVAGPMMNVEKTKLPDRFPSDLPLEKGAVIVQNFNQVNAAGEYQASRSFVSAKTVAENYAYYLKTLPALGWKLGFTTPDQRGSAWIFATRGSDSINIRIYQDGAGKVIVAISNISK